MAEHDKDVVKEPFSQITGKELSAVVFVRDYIQLQFDGPVLTITARMSVKGKSGMIGMETPGCKDALVECIGHTVDGVHIQEESISIRLGVGHEIRVSLRGEDRDWRPEAAVLSLPNGVWNTYP